MRLATVAGTFAAGLAFAISASAHTRTQQELCHLITSARHAIIPEIVAMERTTSEVRRRALHHKISTDAPPFMTRLISFMGNGYHFTDYRGAVTDISPNENPARGPAGVNVVVLLKCTESPAAVLIQFPLIGGSGTFARQAPLRSTESKLESFKPVLAQLQRGDRVTFSGIIFPYKEAEFGTRLLYRNVILSFDAKITHLRKN
jgi:hypothetical protein